MVSGEKSIGSISVDSVVDELLCVLPLIHKKLLRLRAPVAELRISKLHFVAMNMIDDEGSLPVCQIARRLGVKKSQMTALVNQLVAQNLVVKQRDPRDKRVTNVVLTDDGRLAIKKFRETVRESIKSRFSCLTVEELKDLATAIKKLEQIGERLQAHDEAVNLGYWRQSKTKRRRAKDE
jgi:DNA-binding MarR family transcriptional regulator